MHNILWDRLKHMLDSKLSQSEMSLAEWRKIYPAAPPRCGEVYKHASGAHIAVSIKGSKVGVWHIHTELTPLEEELIRLLLLENQLEPFSSESEMERRSRELGEWISRCASRNEWHSEVPRSLELWDELQDTRIPLLLTLDQESGKLPSYEQFFQILFEFFNNDTLLIPLPGQEWLILAPDHVLSEMEDLTEEPEEDAEIRDILFSLATGLHQMVTEEWGGQCHVAAHEPICPAKGLVHTTVLLRETIQLGRMFHQDTHVHMPWLVHLERLLSGIPEQVKSRFMETMAVPPEVFEDKETSATLEAFFQMDGKIGETARKLFIHRNTLLYRLDKFKLETGLDVRSFNDALIVRILFLLYKSTKSV